MPEPLRGILASVLRQVEATHRPLQTIQHAWPRLVGKALARHTKPVSLRRGRLVIHVDQPGDNFALSYQRASLLKRLQTQMKGQVEEIVVRPGDVSRS